MSLEARTTEGRSRERPSVVYRIPPSAYFTNSMSRYVGSGQ